MNNYVFQDGEDTENEGILIPRYKAGGRTAPSGKVYPDFKGKPDEDDLVLVRSIVSKKKGDLNVITPDLINKFFKDFTPGAAIGLSFARSLTEGTTQSALGLKLSLRLISIKEGMRKSYLIAGRSFKLNQQSKVLCLRFND